MRKYFIGGMLFFTISPFCRAQEKRALIIGTDHYMPPGNYTPSNSNGRIEFRNLDGCVNDAKSVQSVIVSRFLFNPEKVDTLFNEAATRDAILRGMKGLLEKSKAGDVAFIYYAGHGSQVKNSLSKEADGKDETMVPCDTWKPGVQDIRDKELAKIFNRFIDNGVKLTVIMDCCHSGSLSRGPTEPGKYRYIAESNYDSKDSSSPLQPETRKEGTFLIISAAQDNEFAQEQRDENDLPHGAFTIAFLQALEQQSVNASALNLFSSIRAILKSNGKKQEPVLGGSLERQQETLFGLANGTIPDKSLVAVSGFQDGKVILQGGFALGLYKENELVKFKGNDTLVKLHVDSVQGINKSLASVIKGNITDLKAGDLMEVTNWVSSKAPLLKLFIPSGVMSYDQVVQLAAVNSELRSSDKIKWVNDLEKTDPYISVFYSAGKCYVNIDGAGKKEQKDVTAVAILQLCKKDSSLYFELPPSKELADAIREKLKQNRNITLVNSPVDANYILYGTIDVNGKPSYGLRRAQTSARDSLESMPVQTKNFALNSPDRDSYNSIAGNIYEYALRLSKIRGWLQMTGPKGGKSNFPFHIELVNATTNKILINNTCTIGDNISLHVVADKNYKTMAIPQKYIYIFYINKHGEMDLLFPGETAGSVENKFPVTNNDSIVTDVRIFDYEVVEPVGTDNIFLLATDEPITNYSLIFKQDGVRGVDTRGATNSLANLLNLGNEGTRGFNKSPSNWSLSRLAVQTKH